MRRWSVLGRIDELTSAGTVFENPGYLEIFSKFHLSVHHVCHARFAVPERNSSIVELIKHT